MKKGSWNANQHVELQNPGSKTSGTLGPMAQDFYAAFGVGEDNKHITTIDSEGVALAAIKGLNQKLDAQIEAKDAELQQLKQTVAKLQQAVMELAARQKTSERKMKSRLLYIMGMIGLTTLTTVVRGAESYTMDWYKISGGGGTSTNGQYLAQRHDWPARRRRGDDRGRLFADRWILESRGGDATLGAPHLFVNIRATVLSSRGHRPREAYSSGKQQLGEPGRMVKLRWFYLRQRTYEKHHQQPTRR